MRKVVYIFGIALGFTCCMNGGGKKPNSEQSESEQIVKTSQKTAAETVPAQQQVSEDGLASGNKLSSFQKYKNKEQLIGEFGADQVVSNEIWLEEGTVKKELSILYEGTVDEVSFVWEENGPVISISGDSSKWQTDNGVKLGMSIADLVKLNAAPLSFVVLAVVTGVLLCLKRGF